MLINCLPHCQLYSQNMAQLFHNKGMTEPHSVYKTAVCPKLRHRGKFCVNKGVYSTVASSLKNKRQKTGTTCAKNEEEKSWV